MQIEIWSDIICPFCYIGKRKFELALEQFSGKDNVQIIWKSFQLDPLAHELPGVSVIENLAEKKGISIEHSLKLHDDVTSAAAEVGLEYNFDKAVIANTLLAHQLTHIAAKHNLQDKAEEALFRAYFTEGKNIGHIDTLAEIAAGVGLDPAETRTLLEEKSALAAVREDIQEATRLGIRGVPFFVFNRQYAVSGAQPVEVFADTLRKVFEEEGKLQQVAGSDSCDLEGNCN